jgi:hypothetical protein
MGIFSDIFYLRESNKNPPNQSICMEMIKQERIKNCALKWETYWQIFDNVMLFHITNLQ